MLDIGKKSEREDVAWILDYLPYGHLDDPRPVYQKKPLVQAVGERNFVLIEMVPKEGVVPKSQDRVYIGDGDRTVIDHVKRRIGYKDLTHGAQVELPFIIEKIILGQEPRFVEFFNQAYPITTRLHMLELLPGIGKKLMWAIIEERKKGKFSSFKELIERIRGLHAPEKILAHRVIDELKDEQVKYRVFTTSMKAAAPKR